MKYVGTAIFLAMLATTTTAKPAETNLPSGVAAYSLIPATSATTNTAVADYRIGPLDTVDVTVYQEPDLSAKALQVDAAGQIALPLVGTVAGDRQDACRAVAGARNDSRHQISSQPAGDRHGRRVGFAEGLHPGRGAGSPASIR